MKYIVKSPLASKTMDFPKNKSYIFAHKRLAYIIMEQKKIEHITLNLIVFGTIVIIGVLARQTALHYGWDEFSSNLILVVCSIVIGAIYLNLQMVVSIRSTTGIKPLYTTIATVTMNLIVSAAIVLLNPYVTVYISYKIPPFALSVHIPDVSTSIYVEVDSKVLLGLPFCDKASGRLHHSGTPLGLHRVPYR